MTKEDSVPLFTAVDDESYEELSELAGQKVVYSAVWEDSLAAALEGEEDDPANQTSFDVDLYLEDGVYFELYSVSIFATLDGDPWQGLEQASSKLAALAKRGLTLVEIAVDDDDELVLVLGSGQQFQVYLVVGAWLLEEWDELPD